MLTCLLSICVYLLSPLLKCAAGLQQELDECQKDWTHSHRYTEFLCDCSERQNPHVIEYVKSKKCCFREPACENKPFFRLHGVQLIKVNTKAVCSTVYFGKLCTTRLSADTKPVCAVRSRHVSVWPEKPSRTLTARQGGKNVSRQNLTPASPSGPVPQQKWPALACETSVQPECCWRGPRDLPAPASFQHPHPHMLHLLEWHVAAPLKGILCYPLWCPPLCPKQPGRSPVSLLSIYRFFCSGERLLKWSRQRADLRDSGGSAAPGDKYDCSWSAVEPYAGYYLLTEYCTGVCHGKAVFFAV